jgi:hypothetical protein
MKNEKNFNGPNLVYFLCSDGCLSCLGRQQTTREGRGIASDQPSHSQKSR